MRGVSCRAARRSCFTSDSLGTIRGHLHTARRPHPDPEIIKNVLEFSFEQLSTKLRELAYLNSGLEIVIRDERNDRSQSFKFEGGIATYVADLNANKTPISDVIAFSGTDRGWSQAPRFRGPACALGSLLLLAQSVRDLPKVRAIAGELRHRRERSAARDDQLVAHMQLGVDSR